MCEIFFASISQTPFEGFETSAPMAATISAIKRTSLKSGTFLRTHFWSVRSVAAKIGRQAFFAPATETSPSSFDPPLIKRESIF